MMNRELYNPEQVSTWGLLYIHHLIIDVHTEISLSLELVNLLLHCIQVTWQTVEYLEGMGCMCTQNAQSQGRKALPS